MTALATLDCSRNLKKLPHYSKKTMFNICWNISLRPRSRARSWSLCWGPWLSVTCIYRSERDSFLLLLHLSCWNAPLHSQGGRYQNNLAYIPRITRWSVCIELKGKQWSHWVEVGQWGSRAEVCPFSSASLRFENYQESHMREREKPSVDTA